MPVIEAREVLYLDFDGVLHPEDVYRRPGRGIFLGPKGYGHSLFENAELLAEMLQPYPAVRVVLSTSWVRVLSYSRAVKWLPASLRERTVGATYHSEFDNELFASMTRGGQVLADVARRRPVEWVAVDDDEEGWPALHLTRWVQSDPLFGISHPAVRARLAAVLAQRFGRQNTNESAGACGLHEFAGTESCDIAVRPVPIAGSVTPATETNSDNRRPESKSGEPDTREVLATVMVLVPEYELVYVEDEQGYRYALTPMTAGIDLRQLREGQSVVCTVETQLGVVVRARSLP